MVAMVVTVSKGSYYSFGNGAASFWGEVVVLVLIMVLQPEHMVLAEVLLMTPLFRSAKSRWNRSARDLRD